MFFKKPTLLLLAYILTVTSFFPSADAEERAYKYYAPNGQRIGWIDGYESGATWFGEDFAYDITDEEACWELLQRPITVLDVGEKQTVFPLDAPNGNRVLTEWQGGAVNGSLAAVRPLSGDEDGWTLIEWMDCYDRRLQGYVRTNLLKTVVPHKQFGIIIDKLYQRLYMFIDGKLWSSCAISTGLWNEKQPYNETNTGEFLIGSWVGGFDSEGMYCDMAIRFNGGDLLHMVPGLTLSDGSRRYDRFEALLGQKASHGCVRIPRVANAEGLNIQWLWGNLKKGTKVIVWDDDGRLLPYPDDSLKLYYNPDGGKNYHALENCSAVRSRFLPLAGFTYAEMENSPYDKLTPCGGCSPVMRKSEIDQGNLTRGAVKEADLQSSLSVSMSEAVVAGDGSDDPTHFPVEIVVAQ